MRNQSQAKAGEGGQAGRHEELHIFVNRRKFEDGRVQEQMKGRDIAALVDVPADVAVIRRGNTAAAPEVGIDEVLIIKNAEHFLVTRKVVEGGYETPERIRRELAELAAGGQVAQYFANGRDLVLYRDVPVTARLQGVALPEQTDVVVPVPSGYPAAMIDLAGLPVGSPLLPRIAGGSNNQGIVIVEDRQFQLASYHPHNNGGGPQWDQSRHGFHTYFDELLAWLAKVG
jgi:hypothetical protein